MVSGIQVRDVQSGVEMRVMGGDIGLQGETNINRGIGNGGVGPCGLKDSVTVRIWALR